MIALLDVDHMHCRSIRLKGRDYALPGAYFVTICTRERSCLFGHVINGEMHLNEAGGVPQRCWEGIPAHFPFVELDAFVIMPNHVHGVIVVPGRGTACRAPTIEQFGKPAVRSIPTIVRSYKATVTHLIRRRDDGATNLGVMGKGVMNHAPTGFGWQRGYYEHIIRNEAELTAIREDVVGNPARWDDDENNPAGLSNSPNLFFSERGGSCGPLGS